MSPHNSLQSTTGVFNEIVSASRVEADEEQQTQQLYYAGQAIGRAAVSYDIHPNNNEPPVDQSGHEALPRRARHSFEAKEAHTRHGEDLSSRLGRFNKRQELAERAKAVKATEEDRIAAEKLTNAALARMKDDWLYIQESSQQGLPAFAATARQIMSPETPAAPERRESPITLSIKAQMEIWDERIAEAERVADQDPTADNINYRNKLSSHQQEKRRELAEEYASLDRDSTRLTAITRRLTPAEIAEINAANPETTNLTSHRANDVETLLRVIDGLRNL